MPSLIANNHLFHKMLIEGVPVEYKGKDRGIVPNYARLIDFEDIENNEWVVINQFTVEENHINRRPDIVVFINGLPIAVIELKNPTDENATIWTAFKQLQTYKEQIPSLFTFNEILAISDGVEARIGSLTANREWFLPWKTIEGKNVAPTSVPQLEVLIKGLFDRRRLLEYLHYFIVFEDEGSGKYSKKIAGYHQFHAVNAAVEETLRATDLHQPRVFADQPGKYWTGNPKGEKGDHRIGIIWHTQGSGKSLTMAFYSGKIILNSNMENPTIVVITDRNDLDDQLFGTFARCNELLRQKPVQAESRNELRKLLQVASGGVIFTTIQKFLPDEKNNNNNHFLSDRQNVVVIADEAHRSQYDFIDGLARHLHDALPNASFIGFTGTPLELIDRNTRAVFGDYISIYDIQRAVQDGATVPIYYESRLAKLDLDESEKPKVDEEFEEVTEGEEVERKEKLKTKWAQLEAVVGSEKRLELIAKDLVEHFEKREEAMDGKAMIVCMSRRICVDLYDEIVKLRPEWHSDDDSNGSIKIVMTGSAPDPIEWQKHIRNKARREELAKRFKNPTDPFKIVIVRDMWLTGFDAPCLHTMYIDKPMRGHNLMQAIARVNRVFKDKPGGLVVDYLGLADQLRNALANYTQNGGTGTTAIDQEEAVAIMLEKYEICLGLFHGFDWSAWASGTSKQCLKIIPQAMEFILAQKDGKERFLKSVTELSKAFALAVPHEKALEIRDDVGFFQAVRAAIAKSTSISGKTDEDLDQAIKQIISKTIVSEKVIDIFDAAGIKKPDISILSDEFLVEMKDLPQKNLAVELLRKLLNDEIKTMSKKNLVKSRSFSEMLEKTMKEYQSRAIETAEALRWLISLAKEMREENSRSKKLHLSDEEVAFYDALATNESAVNLLGDETLKKIAKELVETVQKNLTIDWSIREGARAKLRVLIKRTLKRYNYPPDKQELATNIVIEQTELFCGEQE